MLSPFFCFFYFSNKPGQKLWQKPRISPSPNYQCYSWACGARSLKTTTLKLAEGLFFRSRLCNAEKQYFCQNILSGAVGGGSRIPGPTYGSQNPGENSQVEGPGSWISRMDSRFRVSVPGFHFSGMHISKHRAKRRMFL